MQITLEKIEILAAIKEYIKNQGLFFGDKEPQVILTTNGNKKNPEINASIELNSALKIAMGPGEIETLPDKTIENKAAFTPESDLKKTKKIEPIKDKKFEPIEEDTTEVVEDLFGGAAGNITDADPVEEEDPMEEEEEVTLKEEEEGAVTTDSLFA